MQDVEGFETDKLGAIDLRIAAQGNRAGFADILFAVEGH
jgi:hypothetical protein